MEILDNIGPNRLGDKLAASIGEGAKLSIISAYFTVFAYGELKDELSKIDSVRFLFSEPTFVEAMEQAKDPRLFEIERNGRERGIGGTGLELTLRNNLNQRALARECAEWVCAKGTFKTSCSQLTVFQRAGICRTATSIGTRCVSSSGLVALAVRIRKTQAFGWSIFGRMMWDLTSISGLKGV